MFKRVLATFLLTIVFSISIIYIKANAIENSASFLIIYDSEFAYGEEDNVLNNSILALLSLNSKVRVRTFETFTEDELIKAKGIILVINGDKSINTINDSKIKNFINKVTMVINGQLQEGELNISSQGGMIEFSNYIRYKYNLNSKGNDEIGSYILFDKVYPYDDLSLLIEKADYLNDLGIPFLVEAMPVYDNTDLEAMKRYCEVLRYVQSRGGTIISGEIQFFSDDIIEGELIEKQEKALQNFYKYMVYPIGITIRNEDIYKKERINFLSKSSTVFLESGDINDVEYDGLNIGPFSNFIIKTDESFLSSNLKGCAYKFDIYDHMDEFKEIINFTKKNTIYIQGGERLFGKVDFENYKVKSDNEGIRVNGNKVNPYRFISNDTLDELNGIGKKEETKEEVVDLTRVNKGIFLIIITGVIVFIVFLVIGFRRDRRKYFK